MNTESQRALQKTTRDLYGATAEINRLHSEICAAARTTLEKAIRVGELLNQVKESLVHGAWLPWLKENVAFDVRTAQRYMRVFEHRSLLKNDTVSHLSMAYSLLTESGQTIESLRPDLIGDDKVRALIEEFEPKDAPENHEAIKLLTAINTLLETGLEYLKATITAGFDLEQTQKATRSQTLYDQAIYLFRSGRNQIDHFLNESSQDISQERIRQLAALCHLLQDSSNLLTEFHLYAELHYGEVMNAIIADPQIVRIADLFTELRKTQDFKKNPAAVCEVIKQDLGVTEIRSWLILSQSVEQWRRSEESA
jgi:hypothetical protein